MLPKSLQSKPAEDNKEIQEHEQSTVEASYIISNLSTEYQTICDPFCGVGTTGISALKLNRKFVGVETDEAYFMTATYKLRTTMMALK